MRGRPPSGIDLVGEVEGSGQARRRLKVMLETLAGSKKISEACEELGIGEAQFHKLRHRMMAGAVASLEPSPAGRPAADRGERDERLAEVQEENRQLRIELRASQIREEIALLMPHLAKVPEAPKKNRTSKSHPTAGAAARKVDREDLRGENRRD